jgi:hypothetical protein
LGGRAGRERHENALQFWQVEVPKIQAEFPEFKPQNAEQMMAAENKQFAEQKKTPYVNSGIIVLLGLMAGGAVIYGPMMVAKIKLALQPQEASKKRKR